MASMIEPLPRGHFSPPRAFSSPAHKRKERSASPTGAVSAAGRPSANAGPIQIRDSQISASQSPCLSPYLPPCLPPLLVVSNDRSHDFPVAGRPQDCDSRHCFPAAAAAACGADSADRWPAFSDYATPRDVSRPLPEDFRQRTAAAAAANTAASADPTCFQVRSLASEIPPTFWEAQRAQKQQRAYVPPFRSKAAVSPPGTGNPKVRGALGREGARGSKTLMGRALHGLVRQNSGNRIQKSDASHATITGGSSFCINEAALEPLAGGDSFAAVPAAASPAVVPAASPNRSFLARTRSVPAERASRLDSLFSRQGSRNGRVSGGSSGKTGFFRGSRGRIEEMGGEFSREGVLKSHAIGRRVLPRENEECDEGYELDVPEVVTCFGTIRP